MRRPHALAAAACARMLRCCKQRVARARERAYKPDRPLPNRPSLLPPAPHLGTLTGPGRCPGAGLGAPGGGKSRGGVGRGGARSLLGCAAAFKYLSGRLVAPDVSCRLEVQASEFGYDDAKGQRLGLVSSGALTFSIEHAASIKRTTAVADNAGPLACVRLPQVPWVRCCGCAVNIWREGGAARCGPWRGARHAGSRCSQKTAAAARPCFPPPGPCLRPFPYAPCSCLQPPGTPDNPRAQITAKWRCPRSPAAWRGPRCGLRAACSHTQSLRRLHPAARPAAAAARPSPRPLRSSSPFGPPAAWRHRHGRGVSGGRCTAPQVRGCGRGRVTCGATGRAHALMQLAFRPFRSLTPPLPSPRPPPGGSVDESHDTVELEIKVEGMMCGGCT